MHSKKEKTPTMKEAPKRLAVITQSANSPKTKPISDFFLSAKKDSTRYIDKESSCLPSSENTGVANGRLEEQLKRLECTLFVYINPVKGDKVRITVGRTHEYQIIDMAHFDIVSEDTLGAIPIDTGSLAVVIVNGRSSSPRLQNLLLDLLRESLPTAAGISVCNHAYGLTFVGEVVTLDVLKVTASPFSISPISPSITLTTLNTFHCSESSFKTSKKIVRQTEKKVKNVEKGPLNSTLGVLHLEKQNLAELRLSKGKALRERKTRKR
ncbi:ribosome production factor 2 [Nematocida displodere]|uniref:Ribosome production factor 2 homolog n=1 Tax=Nematocida displodere TaxID=1805483 RepID=A0A177EC50_9MICR|nr:ribosome production factor 2 [Nematocida displodere]